MAEYILENDKLRIKVNSLGGEMKSLINKENGREYMWCANPKFWNKTSPILFPMVGRCIDREYTYKGKTYPMTIHGFANYSEFELVSKSEDSLTIRLTDNEETRKMYPFSFELIVNYTIKDEQIKVKTRVNNLTDDVMYFMLGAHPGFNCPIDPALKRSDYYLHFEGKEEIINRGVDLMAGLVNDVYTTYKLDNGYLNVDDHLFDGDALLFENQGIKSISLTGPDKRPYVTVTMDAPIWGVWSSNLPESNYVCLEPWHGRCDELGVKRDLNDKEYINKLEVGQSYEEEYSITI